ncbi:hypothetical protein F5884DRAFT_47657 [Xylogone sp. PMI_703]|nr:hypothetical protein F5884DRAFT_47657 [Xylogone sp. PMI_703]
MEDSTSTSKPYSIDPVLYLYTSLTAGSSHIITATSRLETILKANRIPFRGIDIATDEKARMLWGRRAGKDESGRQRKLPGLVQEGFVIGDIVEIEEWNEYGELKQHVKIVNDGTPVIMTPPAILPQMGEKKVTAPAPPSPAPAVAPAQPKTATKAPESPAAATKDDDASSIISLTESMRRLGQEAAKKAKDTKTRSIRSSLERSSFEGKGRAESSSKPGTPRSTKTASLVSLESKASNVDSSLPSRNAARQSMASTTSKAAADDHTSLQSPNSTAWKPTDVDPPVHSYRGSDLADASPEEIKKIEQDEAIPEADEEDESSDKSSSETSDEDDEDSDEDSDEEVKKEAKEKIVEKPKTQPKKEETSSDDSDDDEDDDEDDEDEDESSDDSDDERNGHASVQAPAEKERGAEEAAQEPQKPRRTD